MKYCGPAAEVAGPQFLYLPSDYGTGISGSVSLSVGVGVGSQIGGGGSSGSTAVPSSTQLGVGFGLLQEAVTDAGNRSSKLRLGIFL